MKILFAAFLIVVLAALIHGGCIGRPRTPSCHEDKDEGTEKEGYVGRRMWYYSKETRQCEQMQYKGYGGNDNRWCTLSECSHHCVYESGDVGE
ncbi:chymotrypsin inhibitor SCI-III [Musca domestica]|uniref:Chymotrypsin inhibitor SCI-III n=1 Tax=Musca domestica TaxID=7370 RepID=A0A1I8NCQ9_MUSDO|nr:chymotrypsin inhibitor SCI-III [Musca domestica]